VNLIGDHIDYLGGTVLPMSLDRGTWFAFEAADAPGIEIHALDRGESLRIDPGASSDAVPPGAAPDWSPFVRGLLTLGRRGFAGRGGRIHVAGDLAGGGLSSSASFCVGLARVFMELGVLQRVQGEALARLAQRVEHEFVGVQCGLMDQLAVVFGRSAGAVAIDCRSAAVQPVPLAWGDRRLLAMRSRTPRRLAGGGYNTRRRELAEGLARLGLPDDRIPPPDALRGTSIGTAAEDLPLRRVRHVISEQARVLDALEAAEVRDWARFGGAMSASHASLRDDFDVSTAELDTMVAAASTADGCEGARLTGAGFGGWAIALVRDADAAATVLEAVGESLGSPLGIQDWFLAQPGGPVRVLAPADG
jgi:galactokinase